MEKLDKEAQGLGGSVDSLTGRAEQLIDVLEAWEEMAKSVAAGQQKLTKTVSVTTRALKRTITAFDKINRLAGASSTSRTYTTKSTTQETPEDVKKAIQSLLKAMEPANSFHFGGLMDAFQNLWDRAQPILSRLGEGIGWLWQQVCSPFAAWVTGTLSPSLINGLAGGVDAVSTSLERVRNFGLLLQESLKPVSDFIGQQATSALEGFAGVVQGVSQRVQDHAPAIGGVFTTVSEKITQTGQTLAPAFATVGGLFTGLSDTASTVAGRVKTAFGGITTFLSGSFSGSWTSSWEGMKTSLKGVVNGIIGILNRMLTSLGSGINNVIRAANKVKFTVPSWVPGLGGKTYGFSMSTISVPTVPYLAQGAVLPANKPFLAMVGDQRHGTNVEAPLTTIQEAVANVMADQKGSDAVVAKLSQILEAVLGIRLGDREVYEAHDRYRSRMAMIHGGI